jgi:hypothetical protein
MTVFYMLRALIDAIREGQIPITVALDRICNDPAIREQTKDLMREPHIFDEGFPQWLVELLATEGLTQQEIEHAAYWPAEQKEALRAEISYAYDKDLPLSFGWDVTRSEEPESTIQRRREGGSHIVLLSPRVMLEERPASA